MASDTKQLELISEPSRSPLFAEQTAAYIRRTARYRAEGRARVRRENGWLVCPKCGDPAPGSGPHCSHCKGIGSVHEDGSPVDALDWLYAQAGQKRQQTLPGMERND